jgi:hypothetical protein
VRQIIITVVFFIFSIGELYAFDKRLSLDIARAKNIERVVQRVNHIYDFVNLFVLETGGLPDNMNDLTGRYPNLQIQGFNGANIDFTIANNLVSFQNVMARNNTNSGLLEQLYMNHVMLHPMANVVNDPPNGTNHLNMDILLEAKTIGFLNKVNSIELFDDDNNDTFYDADDIFIQDTAPNCNDAPNHDNDIWYQPDGMGGFIMYSCLVGNAQPWMRLTNDVNIFIYRSTRALLDNLTPPVGTIGYITDPNDGNFSNEFIFTGDTAPNQWKQVR